MKRAEKMVEKKKIFRNIRNQTNCNGSGNMAMYSNKTQWSFKKKMKKMKKGKKYM